jgi:hypothetical protein
MKSSPRVAALAVVLAVVGGACSASTNGSPDALSSQNGGPGSGSGGGSGGGSGSVALPAVDGSLPPETKIESNYQSPVATGKIVWTANPTSGRVAYVDATTFNVQTVQAGDGPTYLAAVPNPDPNATSEAAIVINVRSHNATLLRRDDRGGTPSATTFPSTADANSWTMSPSGRWAIAWTDATRISTGVDPTQGFQDLAVLDLQALSPRPPTILAVGYRPSQVVFSKDETRAFAVTQDGISVIDLLFGSRPTATQNFLLSGPIADDASAPEAATADDSAPETSAPDASTSDAPASDAAVEGAASDGPGEGAAHDGSAGSASNTVSGGMPDVSFTPEGAFALVRQAGVAAITIISLKDGSATRVSLPTAPTDLTVAPDGTFAVAVVGRRRASVARDRQ